MVALIALVGGVIAKIFTVEVAKMVAMRLMLWSLFTLVLPVVLFNVFLNILESIMDVAMAHVSSGGLESSVISFTGMAGWMAVQMNLSGAFAIFLSAVALKYALSFLRL